MINLMEKTESAFHTDEELISGDIYMGCGETPAMEFITGIFKGIQNDYPHVHFHIFSGDAEAVMERLDKEMCIRDRYNRRFRAPPVFSALP